jgi:hypothetical protein
MATYIDRALTIINALRNTDTSTEQATDIVNTFCRYIGLSNIQKLFGPEIMSIDDLTSSQKSQIFVELMKRLGKRVLIEEAKNAIIKQSSIDISIAEETVDNKL